MSKKCPKCGSILFDTVNFCPNCGFQLISKSQENQKTHRNSLETTKISNFLNNSNFLKTSHIYFHIKNFIDFRYEHDSHNKEKNNSDKEKSSNNLSFLESPRNKILLILILLPVIFYGGFLTLVILLLICVLYYFYMKNHTNSEYIQDSQNKENNYNYTKNYNTYEYKKNTANLKEKEIQRLIDSLGKEDPVQGILTDDEILKYAGNSKTASKIRLKRGIGNQSDKSKVNNINTRYIILYVPIFLIVLTLFVCGFTITLNSYGAIFFIFIFFMMIGYLCIGGGYIVYCVYTMYIKDYTEPQFKQNTQKENKKTEHTTNDDLLLLFKSKEKIAREMIEKRFPAPQITNTKFNAVLDNCKEVVEAQIKTLNALTPTEKTAYEIESRKKLIKQVITKIDDLTNELILSEPSNIENVIEEMDDLIKSIKEYE